MTFIVSPRHISNNLGDKAIYVSQFVDHFSHWFATAMACIVVDPSQKGWLVGNLAQLELQSGYIFIGMQWHHTVIMVCSCDQHCWEWNFLDGVQG